MEDGLGTWARHPVVVIWRQHSHLPPESPSRAETILLMAPTKQPVSQTAASSDGSVQVTGNPAG